MARIKDEREWPRQWVTRDNKTIPLPELTDSHLINILKWKRRNMEEGETAIVTKDIIIHPSPKGTPWSKLDWDGYKRISIAYDPTIYLDIAEEGLYRGGAIAEEVVKILNDPKVIDGLHHKAYVRRVVDRLHGRGLTSAGYDYHRTCVMISAEDAEMLITKRG